MLGPPGGHARPGAEFKWDLHATNPHVTSPAVEVTTGMRDYTPLFYIDAITYSCPNPDDGLANSW